VAFGNKNDRCNTLNVFRKISSSSNDSSSSTAKSTKKETWKKKNDAFLRCSPTSEKLMRKDKCDGRAIRHREEEEKKL
jgi:hypothetical protein